jgi:hypothetical protein
MQNPISEKNLKQNRAGGVAQVVEDRGPAYIAQSPELNSSTCGGGGGGERKKGRGGEWGGEGGERERERERDRQQAKGRPSQEQRSPAHAQQTGSPRQQALCQEDGTAETCREAAGEGWFLAKQRDSSGPGDGEHEKTQRTQGQEQLSPSSDKKSLWVDRCGQCRGCGKNQN